MTSKKRCHSTGVHLEYYSRLRIISAHLGVAGDAFKLCQKVLKTTTTRCAKARLPTMSRLKGFGRGLGGRVSYRAPYVIRFSVFDSLDSIISRLNSSWFSNRSKVNCDKSMKYRKSSFVTRKATYITSCFQTDYIFLSEPRSEYSIWNATPLNELTHILRYFSLNGKTDHSIISTSRIQFWTIHCSVTVYAKTKTSFVLVHVNFLQQCGDNYYYFQYLCDIFDQRLKRTSSNSRRISGNRWCWLKSHCCTSIPQNQLANA